MLVEMDGAIIFCGFVAILLSCGKCVSSQSCSSSNIRSPGYPGSYPENTDCTWTKSTSYDTQVISFDISNLDLEQCARCTCDYVELFDGSSKSSKSLGKFCTGQVRLLTTGNYLTVVFHTDHSKGEKQNKGFYATYNYISRSSVCVEESNTIRTNYASYGNLNCSWTSGSYFGYIVVLEVSSLSFGTCSGTCSCGQLDVYDTSAASQTKIGSWCSLPQKSIVSNGNRMFVQLVATPTSTAHYFRATYKYIKEIQVCEQTTDLEATAYSTRTVRSYDRPSKYIKVVDCTWKIIAKDDQLIRFTVSQLDLGGCASCGFLQIFDGQREWTGTNLGKWRSGTPDIISSGKYMTVKFKTTKFDTNNGLIATYYAISKKSVCPTATADQGVLQSYNYPSSYPGNINCFWKFQAPSNYLIRFYTEDVRLSTDCEDRCNFLAVYDGPSFTDTKLGDYKEDNVSLVSSSSQLSIRFKTYKEGNKGFRGNYFFIKKSEVCKDNLNLHASTLGETISSRNFPEKYWGNMHCFWLIQADRDHKIRLIVQTIDFEYCTDCGCDFIHIFNGPNGNSKSLQKWCQNRPDLISTGNYLYIEMQTDGKKSYRGFKAKVFAIHKDDVCPGSGLLTKESGTIKSPNYPEHYYGGIVCDWTITVPDQKRIRIKSRSLNLESCPSCSSCDHIQISDNASPDHPNIGNWCETPFNVISRGNTVHIRFISNVNDVGENFVIEYQTVNEDEVCPISPTSPSSGTLTSLGYPNGNYPGNLNCTYRIKAPNDNQVVRLEFTHFELAACGQYVSSCLNCRDAIQAIDVGDDMKLTRFHPWCSNDPQPTHIFSSGQNLFLNFYTDKSSQDVGFRATYRSVDKNLGCLHTGTLSKTSGNFSGPRSPFNSETLCTWLIKGPTNHKIELSFRYSSVSDRDCSFAYVEVYDGESPTKTSFGRFCEHYWWKTIMSTGSSMYVTLWVDSTIKSNGVPSFYATYRSISEKNAGKRAKLENMLFGFFVVSMLFVVM